MMNLTGSNPSSGGPERQPEAKAVDIGGISADLPKAINNASVQFAKALTDMHPSIADHAGVIAGSNLADPKGVLDILNQKITQADKDGDMEVVEHFRSVADAVTAFHSNVDLQSADPGFKKAVADSLLNLVSAVNPNPQTAVGAGGPSNTQTVAPAAGVNPSANTANLNNAAAASPTTAGLNTSGLVNGVINQSEPVSIWRKALDFGVKTILTIGSPFGVDDLFASARSLRHGEFSDFGMNMFKCAYKVGMAAMFVGFMGTGTGLGVWCFAALGAIGAHKGDQISGSLANQANKLLEDPKYKNARVESIVEPLKAEIKKAIDEAKTKSLSPHDTEESLKRLLASKFQTELVNGKRAIHHDISEMFEQMFIAKKLDFGLVGRGSAKSFIKSDKVDERMNSAAAEKFNLLYNQRVAKGLDRIGHEVQDRLVAFIDQELKAAGFAPNNIAKNLAENIKQIQAANFIPEERSAMVVKNRLKDLAVAGRG